MLDGLTAIVLTRNEEIHIARCIERLKPLAARIVVIDSESTDRTVEIARGLGAEIFAQPFVNHAAQFNWGLEAAGVAGGWILRVDADEWLEPEAIAEIERLLPTLDPSVSAVSLRLKTIFQGRWIRWGGIYPTMLTRLWRPDKARIEPRWMDEHVDVVEGRTEVLGRGHVVDENLRDLSFFTDKHNGYTTRQMIEFLSLELPLQGGRASRAPTLNAGARRRRFLRNSVYARAPLFLRAWLYFLQRYVLRLGFLDGRPGLVFHTLQGFWNMFLIDSKVDEARRFIAAHGIDAFRAQLAARHGIRLVPPAD